MNNFFYNFVFIATCISFSSPVFARCAVCYTQGLSGASIAVIVIVSTSILLFLGNMLLGKFLNRDKV